MSYKTEGFESYSGPTGNAPRTLTFPSTLFGGAASVTTDPLLLDSTRDGIENVPCQTDPLNPENTNCPGRYNTTSGGSQWLQSAVSFSLTFQQAFSAFGFYGTDIGDFAGSLDVLLSNADGSGATASATVSGDGSGNGSLLFLGLVDSANTFDKVTFTISQGSAGTPTDILGFDDMVVGNAKAGSGGTVPEPATLALAGVALAGLGFSRRQRRG